MAMPKSFSEDGALGAQDAGIAGAPPPPPTPAPAAPATGSLKANPMVSYSGGSGLELPRADGSSVPGQATLSARPGVSFGGGDSSFSGGASPVGLAFEDGGAVEGDDTNGSPQQDAISKALDTVDQVLAFGRKAHGLGGNEESGGIQMAANTRMPGQPPSQSESGVKPIQPMPGPLPPTSNPFGKRADAGGDGDGDQDDQPQSGGIDTDEDTA